MGRWAQGLATRLLLMRYPTLETCFSHSLNPERKSDLRFGRRRVACCRLLPNSATAGASAPDLILGEVLKGR